MNFGGSRLGFWFRPPAPVDTTDRSEVKSKNVLIVYDLNNVGTVTYGVDVHPANLAANISARETALGFTPTTITSYSAFTALTDTQIANYAHIWDVGYDTLISTAAGNKYSTYLQGGGAMFLLGENGAFWQRDNSVTNFVTTMGGGSIAVNNGHYVGQAVIQNEFLLGNPNAFVDFYDVANFTAFGSGTPMVVTNGQAGGTGQGGTSGLNVATVWKTGSLSNATAGAICAILDVNWLDNVFFNSIQPNLIDNISIVLNKK